MAAQIHVKIVRVRRPGARILWVWTFFAAVACQVKSGASDTVTESDADSGMVSWLHGGDYRVSLASLGVTV